jgi:hypothetical protein
VLASVISTVGSLVGTVMAVPSVITIDDAEDIIAGGGAAGGGGSLVASVFLESHPVTLIWPLFGLMLGLAVAIGLGGKGRVRPAALGFTILYTLQWVLDAPSYNNHYYLITICGALLACTGSADDYVGVPKAGMCSGKGDGKEDGKGDGNRNGKGDGSSNSGAAAAARAARASSTVPAACLWVFKFQLFVIYLFAGIVKLNPDWVRGEPLRSVMDFSLPPLLREALVFFMASGGLGLDLIIAPFGLLFERTRFLR